MNEALLESSDWTPPNNFGATAYYASSIAGFLSETEASILGKISANTRFAVVTTQRDSWKIQIEILKVALKQLRGAIFFEFVVPRVGSRIDVVVISGAVIIVLEFKVGESNFLRDDLNQAWDYALDLKNFHLESHNSVIVPILVATKASPVTKNIPVPHADNVLPPIRCDASGLRCLIEMVISSFSGVPIDVGAWSLSPYQPTPTIIEAAQSLYSQHSVESIARHDAGAVRETLNKSPNRYTDHTAGALSMK